MLLIALLALPLSAQQNLLQNPGFEADTNGMPDGWTFAWESTHGGDAARGIEKQEPDWGIDRDIKHSGEASVRCGVGRPVDDGVWTQEGIAVPEGAKFLKVTAWCRAENVTDGVGTVAIVYIGAEATWLGADYSAIACIADTDWAHYTGYSKIPAGAETIRFRLWTNFNYAGPGTFWFDDLEMVAVDEMPEVKTIYLDEAEPPVPTADETARGFMLFSRGTERLVFPNSVPTVDERVDSLNISACSGEYEPAMLAVRALRDLSSLNVTVSGLPFDVDVRSVRTHPKLGQSRWGPFNEPLMDAPLFLEKRADLSLAADTNQPYWITVRVADDAKAGAYPATVTISAEGTSAEIPLTVNVHPFALAEPGGITLGMYAQMRDDPEWVRESFADMRAHGMTGIGLGGNSGLALSENDGKITIDWSAISALKLNMDAYARAGFPEPMCWLMGADIPKFCEQFAPIDSDEFAALYTQIIRAINAHGTEVGWPEIIYQPIDEPFEHEKNLDRCIRLLRVLKSIPGVRTEEDGMNGAWHNFTDDAYDLTDVMVLHDGPVLNRGTIDLDAWETFKRRCANDGKLIWFYNIDLTAWHPEPIRFMTGFGLYKSGAQGVIEWCYMWPVKPDDPGKIYSNPKALLYRFPAAPGESGGPCIAYEAAREGIDDYRYLLTLRQLVDRAQGTDGEDVANEIWAGVQARLDEATFEGCKGKAGQGNWTGKCEMLPDGNRAVRGDHKIDNNWDFAEYDSLREQIAAGIIRITGNYPFASWSSNQCPN